MPPAIYPTGVTINLPGKAHDTYVLHDGRDGCTYLVDMAGNAVRSWPYTGFPSEMIDPALNAGTRGHVLLQKEPDVFANETVIELDWDGRQVWEWGSRAPGGTAKQNHDLARLPNGNTIMICKLAHAPAALGGRTITDQAIYEVTRAGDIVWRWVAAEHLDELGFDAAKRRWLTDPTMRPKSAGVLVLNNLAPLGPNRWHRAGDMRFHPDNLMIDAREANFVAIIAKASGEVVWRLGPDYPGSYDFAKKRFAGPLPRPVDSLMGLHDAHMIEDGLPGAGNVLVFDNQGSAGFPPAYLDTFQGSRIVEIDPIGAQIVWQYDSSMSSQPVWGFFSSFISSARRLPNGNTLICEGMNGRIFQVTATGEIVWEYVNPHFGQWVFHLNPTGGNRSNWVFRAQPVPYDWAPEGTPRAERPVIPPDISRYRVGP